MEHVYLVCYDISEPRRWRKVYKIMKGYGEWLQLSVFQCRLNREKVLRLKDRLADLADSQEDHVVIIDIGPAENIKLKVDYIGKPFEPIERKPTIV